MIKNNVKISILSIFIQQFTVGLSQDRKRKSIKMRKQEVKLFSENLRNLQNTRYEK